MAIYIYTYSFLNNILLSLLIFKNNLNLKQSVIENGFS